MPDKTDISAEESSARQALEIERLKDALGLLGVNPCSWCKRYCRRTEPGALFDTGGELICYGCIPEWWGQECSQLNAKDRENLEGKLVFWLRDYHHAEVFKDQAKLPEISQQELHVVAGCLECRGTGTSAGGRCRFCEGRGAVWVIVSRKKG